MQNFLRPRWGGLTALVEREIYRFSNVITQTVIAPVISSFLFIFIFGFALGRAIETMAGFPYLVFIVPGLIALYVIESAYNNASSSLFLSRWSLYIQELLVTPLSYFDLVVAIMAGSLARGLVTGLGVYAVAACFSRIPVHHPLLLAILVIGIVIIFSSIGILVALISEKFEHMAVFNSFIIMPLVYLGGVFTSLEALPHALAYISRFNPFFYMVDGVRFAMLGASDIPWMWDLGLVVLTAAILFMAVVGLFRIGYKLRS